VDVTGAEPNQQQSALLKLWTPRAPHASANSVAGFLEEHWIDNKNPGAAGRAFGSLAGITAEGRDVSVVVTDSLTITVSFKPFADGHFRVIAVAPHNDGTGNAQEIAKRALSPEPDAAHVEWWKDFWKRAGLIRITSKNGAGEYMENLRNIYLFVAAIEKGFEYPGSQAGIADMISSAQDEHRWIRRHSGTGICACRWQPILERGCPSSTRLTSICIERTWRKSRDGLART